MIRSLLYIAIACALFTMGACEKFLDTKLSDSQIDSERVFENEKNATSAVTGMYRTMVSGPFAGGGYDGLGALTGLSSDELSNVFDDAEYRYFQENRLLAEDAKVFALWSGAYQAIYQANDIIEGLANASPVDSDVKRQLKGEALFVRAFCHFYLVNLFGDVPLVTQTDYKQNALVTRTATTTVYDQIKKDLAEAQSLLPEAYAETERVRPNKTAATAMLARVYLYLEDWQNAILQSSSILDNNGNYSLATPNNVFLKNSTEVIWQLSSDGGVNTQDGTSYVMAYGPGYGSKVVSRKLLDAYETGDARKAQWVGIYNDGTQDYHYPYKYKAFEYGMPITEYFVVLRSAEQYLVRSEARARQGDIAGAIADLDMIRERAGIPLIADINPGISQDDLLLAIEKERWLELFTEWGHRWFDLKRTGRAIAVLSAVKPGITAEDLLYPVPQSEFDKNPRLGDQNDGY
ncbi:RagB/SusD family nutrient uptake outer membrane protein [Chitinophaga sp. YIM B06452]|uniref:RagB/SusD family nutrient uptake outer membrane protein n=1 Tax=Chitinophaga sp. YIM B06452 TaxID=3082158 RepID=UPI0031FE4B78